MTIPGGAIPRVVVKTPIVEMDGDEMTRVIWAMVKKHLIEPFVDVKLEAYDLHLPNRDRTDDAVTVQAAEAIRKYGVGVKCATITANDDRVAEYKLKKAWPSPNGTIRAILDGTVFRKPIVVKNVPPMIRSWEKPIIIGRHAYGDMYRSAEMRIRTPGRAEIVFTPADGSEPQRVLIHEFKASGIVRGVHNLDGSIRSFAKACITYALADRVAEYKLKKAWPSPNGTIRAILDGTVFRKPIVVKNVPPMIRSWEKPIIIGRHAYGDMYRSAEMRIRQPGRAEIVFTPADGSESQRVLIHEFKASGIVRGVHNLDGSIRSFAKACITYALHDKVDLWFSGKDTIAKIYHGAFREIFRQEVEARKADFEKAGITYSYLLIDDAVARAVRHQGGFLWACMNYDGDVMSDMIASGFGSLGLMTSVLVSPEGHFEYEAAHGTVQRHYYQHLKGEPTSTNSTATIFAWSGALAKRGELDGTPELVAFAKALEASVIETIESGIVTKDLALIAQPAVPRHVTTEGFITAIGDRLAQKLGTGLALR